MFMAASAGGTLARRERTPARRDPGSHGAWGFDAAFRSFHGLRPTGIRFQPSCRRRHHGPNRPSGGGKLTPNPTARGPGQPGGLTLAAGACFPQSASWPARPLLSPRVKCHGRVLTGCRMGFLLIRRHGSLNPRRRTTPHTTAYCRVCGRSTTFGELTLRSSRPFTGTAAVGIAPPALSQTHILQPPHAFAGSAFCSRAATRLALAGSGPADPHRPPLAPGATPRLLFSSGYLLFRMHASAPSALWQGRGAGGGSAAGFPPAWFRGPEAVPAANACDRSSSPGFTPQLPRYEALALAVSDERPTWTESPLSTIGTISPCLGTEQRADWRQPA